jgi:hypothetical protein
MRVGWLRRRRHARGAWQFDTAPEQFPALGTHGTSISPHLRLADVAPRKPRSTIV